MINVSLDTNIGKSFVGLIIGLQAARVSLQNRMESEKKSITTAVNDIIKQKENYDMRYNQTKAFFDNPMTARELPIIKKSQLKHIERNNNLLMRNIGRVNSFNERITNIKNRALMKGLRSNL